MPFTALIKVGILVTRKLTRRLCSDPQLVCHLTIACRSTDPPFSCMPYDHQKRGTNATQKLWGDPGLTKSPCSRQKKTPDSQETGAAVWKLSGFSGHPAQVAAPVWRETHAPIPWQGVCDSRDCDHSYPTLQTPAASPPGRGRLP